MNILCEQFWGIYFSLLLVWAIISNMLWLNLKCQTFCAPPMEVAKTYPWTGHQTKNTKKSHGRFKNLVVEDSGQNNRNKPRCWFQRFFLCSPLYLGKWYPNFDEHIYQVGWWKTTNQQSQQQTAASLKSGLHCEEACHHGEVLFVTWRRVESSSLPGRAGLGSSKWWVWKQRKNIDR